MFTRSDHNLHNEILLHLRILEETAFLFHTADMWQLVLTDLFMYVQKLFNFLYEKVPKQCFDASFMEKLHMWSLLSESYCLSLSFGLIRQTSQAHDEGRISCCIFE